MSSKHENKLTITKNFYFQYKNNDSAAHFLGWEYFCGSLLNHKMNELFSNLEINFFPLIHNRIDQTILIDNLEKSNFFKQFNLLYLDWPEEFISHLNKVTQSFPQAICLTKKDVLEEGVYKKSELNHIAQIEQNPVYFLESYCARRQIAKNFGLKNIYCVGGLDSCLQWQFATEIENSNYLLTGGLFPWLEAQFLSCEHHYFLKDLPQTQKLVYENAFKNILRNLKLICLAPALKARDDNLIKARDDNLIKARDDNLIKARDDNLIKARDDNQIKAQGDKKKILIVAHFQFVHLFNQYLDEINHDKNLNAVFSDKIVSFQKTRSIPLFISKSSEDSSLEYSKIDGFVSRNLIAKNDAIEDWLDFYKTTLSKLFSTVCVQYKNWTKMNIGASEQRDFFRFAYRLAKERGRLFPNSFDLLVSAKSIINSNFAYELHKEIKNFPTHQLYETALKEIDLPLDSFYEKTQQIKLQKFATIQSQKFEKKTKLLAVQKNRTPKKVESTPEDKYADNSWVDESHPYSCSFPSEDIFMEKLAFDLKKNMQEKVRAKEQIFRELQSDFCDGLDIRETIRNWHNEKIIVTESLNVGKADIGAVVFSFAEINDDGRFSWRSFWLAEQHDTSHLMFYATPFRENLIGPGIAKSEFGGFAVIPLDAYLDHPWEHPYILTHAQNCTESLILAGALSTNHKSVLLISHHPPSQHIIKILKQSGKNIIYAKLDDFSQADIRKVRTFHILAEAGVRNYAQKYIRKD